MTSPAARVLDSLFEPRRFAALLVLASAALGCWSLPYEMPSPDAGAVLTQAMKVARGAVYYRDVDSYPLPAAPYLLAAAMRVFGEHLLVARALAAVTFTAVVVSGWLAMLFLAGRRVAALGALWLLAWKFFAYPAFQDALYPDVALAFAMGSIAAFLRFRDTGRRATIVAAGLLAAMALLSKQNLGLYLGAATGGLLLVTGRRDDRGTTAATRLGDVAAFGVGAALPLAIAAAYFQAHGVLGAALYSGFVRPFTGYLPTSGLSYLVPLEWWRLGRLRGPDSFGYAIVPLFFLLTMERLPFPSLYPLMWLAAEVIVRLLYTAVPVVFVASALVAFRDRRPLADRTGVLGLAVLALAVFASAFPRADYYHVAGVYPAVIVLAFVTGERLLDSGLAGAWTAFARRVAAAATALVFAASLVLTAVYFHGLTQPVGNARGSVRVPPQYAWTGDVIAYLDATLEGDDPLFVYGHEAYWYFFSGHTASWPFVQLYPGMTGDDGGKALVDTLRRDPPAIVVRGVLAGWPGLAPVTDYAADLQAFLDECYEATMKPFSDGIGPDAPAPPGWLCTVMQRRASPGGRCGW